MAFSSAEIESFIAALHDDPRLRDRVRDVILSDDFLALPGIVRGLGEGIDRLTGRIDGLTVRMDDLTVRLDALTARVDALTEQVTRLVSGMDLLNGRIGNLEGWRYQSQYADNLATHLVPMFWHGRLLVLGNFAPLLDALGDGRLAKADWDDLVRLNVLASARRERAADSPEVLLAIELSIVVDESDVQRVHRRAELLRRTGLEVEACVDGDVIGQAAQRLADQLGVRVLHAQELAAA